MSSDDNVVYLFPKKQTPSSEHDSSNVDTSEYDNFVLQSNFPPIVEDVVKKLPLSPYLNDLPYDFWDLVSLHKGTDEENDAEGFLMKSLVRPTLVADFGTLGHQEFTQIKYKYFEEKAEGFPVPSDLLERMGGYFKSYPETNAYLSLFCFALLALLVEHPDIEFMADNISPDMFGVQFGVKTKTEKGWLQLAFFADFLPLLLDDAAMRMRLEQQAED